MTVPREFATAVRPGEHACSQARDPDDRLRLAIDFARDGLSRGEKVILFCDGDQLGAIESRLRAEDDRAGPAVDSGQIVVCRSSDAYTPDGAFDVDAMLALVREEKERAIAEGYPAVRMTGDMSWALSDRPGTDRLTEYERRFGEAITGERCLGLCQYDHSRFPRDVLIDAADAHDVNVVAELAAVGREGCLAAAVVGPGPTLRLAGELDYDCAETLRSAVRARFAGPLTVDLADLTFADVTGLRALRGGPGQRLTITAASGTVGKLIRLLAWDTDPAVELAAI